MSLLQKSCCVQWFIMHREQLSNFPRNRIIFVCCCIDLAVGICIHCATNHELEIDKTLTLEIDGLINWLHALIQWLMGNPAGLKLNKTLNAAVGNFFLYHLYLWQTYITFVHPCLHYALLMLKYASLAGATLSLAVTNDLISLLTVHIHGFYVYATRLYQLEVLSLISLWRLFRGKKYNPLRKRIDTMEYDSQQLFLGTLLFTALLFLLPTVMVYYVVFFTLRCFVLILQWSLVLVSSCFYALCRPNRVDIQRPHVFVLTFISNLLYGTMI